MKGNYGIKPQKDVFETLDLIIKSLKGVKPYKNK